MGKAYGAYSDKPATFSISFTITQRRPMNGTFDPQPFEKFEAFVQSFKFLKKTFYEEMEEKMKKLKG